MRQKSNRGPDNWPLIYASRSPCETCRIAEPGPADPDVADPETAEPDVGDPDVGDPDVGDPDVGDATPTGLVTNLGLGPASLSNTSSNTSLLPRVTCDDAACRKYVGKNIFRRLPGGRRDPLGGFPQLCRLQATPFRCAEAKNRFFRPVQ